MSRGLGKWQVYLLWMIRHHGKPMTFADILAEINRSNKYPLDTRLRPSVERSMRRALHSLDETGVLVAMGQGGNGEPLRYFINPVSIGVMGDTPEAKALAEALKADPGADEASRRFAMKILK